MRLASYWLETAPPFRSGQEGPVDGRADVAVVGAGFTGLAAAIALAKRGASIVVLEAGRVASQASGRNGGQCNNGTSHDYAGLAARFGAERAKAYYREHVAAVNAVEALVREEAIDCDFHRPGRVKLAAKPEHFAHIQCAYERLLAEVDPDVQLVPPERIREEVGSDAFFGAMIQTRSAQLHVGKFGQGLAEAAARRGVRIFENAKVERIDRVVGGRRQLTTSRGVIEADQVLIATGATPPVFWFKRRIVPVGSFIIVTEPLAPQILDRLLPNRRNYVTSKTIGNYFRPTPDGRLLFGGRARFAISSPTQDAKSGEVLRATLHEIFPELKGVRLDYCWGGLVDMTQDRLPRAGEHDGLFYAMGFSGHGVQMSVRTGQAMAEVVNGCPNANPWRELDWPAVPGHFGPPWFLPAVGAWYRLQDRLH